MLYLERLGRFLGRRRQTLALLLYAALTGVAYALAFLVRFEFSVPREYTILFTWTVLPLVVIRVAVFRLLRLTRERWRFAGAREAGRLVSGCILGSLLFVVLVYVGLPGPLQVPVSVILTESLLTGGLIAGAWLSYRLSFEHIRRAGGPAEKRVLVIGAGDAGNLLAREMRRTPTGYVAVGFIDDDPVMRGATVQGIPVLGPAAQIPRIAAERAVDELIIALPSAGPEDLRRIVGHCERSGLPFQVLPGMAEVLAGHVTMQQLRDVRIEDLLGREPIDLELPELAADLHGTIVLITGAAGSIGSELARQVALHRPETLILLDQAESDLFFLDLELRHSHPSLTIVPIVADITDGPSIERVFRTHRPQRVFHAAAYKHVPLMEANVAEGIRNNVVGTWRVADAAGRHGAARFVLVSTDKAVCPTNVMGATKRLAELTVLHLQQQFGATTFGAVRFGNVLGSNGSVVPVFRRQISQGQPLTVTHPDTTRYFMTIPEAAQLILQASLLEQFRGHIAMLDMGDPVRITDLALNLLRLSGVRDPESRIVYTGLRPGEKLHEELAASDEEAQPTAVPKVRVLTTPALRSCDLTAEVKGWAAALQTGQVAPMLAGFYDIFPALDRRAANLLVAEAMEPAVESQPPTARLSIIS
jgi:FlaA1/EpsC-like NDP-sugar epimerase